MCGECNKCYEHCLDCKCKKKIVIDCISDLHGNLPSNLTGGDLLIIAGDYTASDKIVQWSEFFSWLKKQNYKKKILVAGNHDNFMFQGFPKNQKEADDLKEVQEFLDDEKSDFEYLCDSGTEFEKLKIWGSPWSKTFQGMNPKCKAFTVDTEEELAIKLSLIPQDTEILITHTPPFGVLDGILMEDGSEFYTGSTALRNELDRIKPRILVFGHIHEHGGKQILYKHQGPNTICINASYVNENYKPVNKSIRIIL